MKEATAKRNIFASMSAFFSKWIVSPLRKLMATKWKWLFIPIASAVFLYVVYAIFSFSSSPHYYDKSLVWEDARYILFRVFCGLIELGLIARGMYLFIVKRLTARKACVLVALLAAMQIMSYSFATPIYDYNSIWNQHDTYYAYASRYYMEDLGIYDCGGGHYGLIMTIFRYNVIPEVAKKLGQYDFSFNILERYQPKTYYFLSAYYMKLNSLFFKGAEGYVVFPASFHATITDFTNTEWALMESTRILYVAMEWLQLVFIYKLLSLLGLKGKGLVVAFSISAIFPMWCFFGNWQNNDGMSFFFAIMGLYFGLKYFKKRTWLSACLSAAFIGLGMSCKLSGGIVAFVVAPFLIAAFVNSIKESKDYKGKMPPWLLFLLQMCVYAIIVFPLGLGWPLYNYIRFGQPLFFFSEIGKSSPLYVTGVNFFSMFLLFPNIDVFKTVWVIHGKGSIYPQDTSFLVACIKTGLYGEYSFNHSIAQAGALYFFAMMLFTWFIVCIPLYIYIEIRYKAIINKFALFAILLMFAAIYGWGMYFCWSNPYVCNMDMRYIAPIIIPFAATIGYVSNKFELLKNENAKKIYNIINASTLLGTMGASLLFYVSLTGWSC